MTWSCALHLLVSLTVLALLCWMEISRQVEDFNAFTAPLAELGDALPLEAKSALTVKHSLKMLTTAMHADSISELRQDFDVLLEN